MNVVDTLDYDTNISLIFGVGNVNPYTRILSNSSFEDSTKPMWLYNPQTRSTIHLRNLI